MIFWLTGQSHAGKTTLANYLKSALMLKNPFQTVHLIDGDDLRTILNNKDYSENGRRANVYQAIGIAKFLDSQSKNDVIVSLVSPYKDQRDELKRSNEVVEIYVHTSDIRGRESYHVSNYQPPTENFIDIDTTGVEEIVSVNEMLTKIQEIYNEN